MNFNGKKINTQVAGPRTWVFTDYDQPWFMMPLKEEEFFL